MRNFLLFLDNLDKKREKKNRIIIVADEKNQDLPVLWLDDLCVVCAWLPYLAVRAANNTLRHIWEELLRLCKQHRHIVPVRRSSPRGLTSLSVHRRKGEPSRTCTDAANAATPPRTLLKSQTEISFATISCNNFKLSLVTVASEETFRDAELFLRIMTLLPIQLKI